jgi:hypothetical protein
MSRAARRLESDTIPSLRRLGPQRSDVAFHRLSRPAGHEQVASLLGRRDLLAGFAAIRCVRGVNAHAGAGHEHRLMTIVPAHDVRWLTARAPDLDHLTTPGRIADVQARHHDPITTAAFTDGPLLARHAGYV